MLYLSSLSTTGNMASSRIVDNFSKVDHVSAKREGGGGVNEILRMRYISELFNFFVKIRIAICVFGIIEKFRLFRSLVG